MPSNDLRRLPIAPVHADALLALCTARSLEPPQPSTLEAAIAVIRIHALGGLSVRGSDGQPMAGAASQPRRMALLALLTRAGSRGMTREKLVALLWPDADDERGARAIGQALYALRRDLGADDTIVGTKDLRLDQSLVTADVNEFASAVSRGDNETAARLYEGPFLDGFYLTEAEEFSRWVERERSALAHDYARVLESLARAASATGDTSRAVTWWRKLAALDPLNARVTVGLMEALASGGDRAGALQHARIYEALLSQELDLAPDRDVIALAAKLRAADDTATAPRRADVAAPVPPVPNVAEPARSPESATAPIAATTVAPPPARRARRARWAFALIAYAAAAFISVTLVVAVVSTVWHSRARAAADANKPVLVVGRIVERGTDSREGVGRTLADLIGTSLARSPGLRVVSTARMYELLRQLGATSADTEASVMTAARHAGATQLIDGSVYDLGGGRVRIDLRRIELTSGAVLHADRIEATDLFVLADSCSLRIVKQLGAIAPSGSLADVTTRSALAYQLYTQGLQSYFAGEKARAATQFAAALDEDSTFAMAAYYEALALHATGQSQPTDLLARAYRLSSRVSDRERLIIRAEWASATAAPNFRAYAESLANRYPDEVQGSVYFGQSLFFAGEFLAAVQTFERVIALDSLSLRGTDADCVACSAMELMIGAYAHADSLDAAERIGRSWVARQPTSPTAIRALARVLEFEGKYAESRAMFERLAAAGKTVNTDLGEDDAALRIRALDFSVDRTLAERIRAGHGEGLFWSVISLRSQGRLDDAMAHATRLRAIDATRELAPGSASYSALAVAQVLFDRGDYRASAALFDSIARVHVESNEPSAIARTRAWFMTHAADARAAGGDTLGLAALADTIEALGAVSGAGRDRRLHHYVRGLVAEARGAHADAVREFRLAIYSPTQGFTRTNLALARALVSLGRPRDAIEALRPALHGPLDAANFYVTHAEVHELLGRAWEQAGNADSATVHYAYVARAWSRADGLLAARAADARRRTQRVAH